MSHFRPGDKVSYVGNKMFKNDNGEPLSVKNKLGIVHASVQGSETSVVVEFGDDSFVMDERVLTRFQGIKDKDGKEIKDKEPEVTHRRRRVSEDDE